MASDVSGNDRNVENEEEVITSSEQIGKGTREEGYQENETESEFGTVASIDYTPCFKDLQNDVRFNSVILLAFLLLFGLLKGLKNYECRVYK